MAHPTQHPPLRWRTLLIVACAWLATALTSHAQSANTGTVQGRVYNPASKSYVGNAAVSLEGTNQVTYTESDGTFLFNNVPAGPATVSVAFSGYTTVKESFTVSAGQVAVREINLVSTEAAAPTTKSGIVQLAAFTVDSEREGNSKAIMEQRRSMNISHSVSSDIFGDVTDGNVGEFLKYLPGVDIDYVESQARGPTLGGMESQYVGVSFDGVRTASADANRGGGDASRATSFEGFSINAIESIDVNFTRTAEADADTPGGTINMRTRRAFDSRGRRIDYNVNAAFNTEEFHLKRTWGNRESKEMKAKPSYSLSYSEAFLNNRLGILASISRASNYDEQYQMANTYSRAATATDPRPLVVRAIAYKDGPLTILKESATVTFDYKVSNRLSISLTGIYTYADSEFWNRTLTFTAANDNANINNGRPSIGGDALTTVVANRAGTANSATVAMSNGPGDKLTYTRTFAPKFEYKHGNWLIDGVFSNSRSVNNYDGHERGFAGGDSLSLPSGWSATRPSSESYEWTIRQTSGPDWFNLANWTGGTRLTNIDRTWITDIWTGALNARWTPSFLRNFPSVVRFGGKWGEEGRDNRTNDAMAVWRYTGPGGDLVTRDANGTPSATASGSWANFGFQARQPFDLGTTNALTIHNIAGLVGQIPRVNAEQTAALFRSNPEQFANIGSPANYATTLLAARKVRQTVTAGYGQIQTRLTSKFTVVGGLRLERTQNVFTELNPRLREEMVASRFPIDANGRATTFAGLEYQFRSQPRVQRRSEYDNAFPNVSLKYNILANLDFQAGYTKAIGRPPIDNLTGVWNVVENADGSVRRVDAPNAALLPEKIDRYDARLAYYFGGKSPGQATVTATQVNTANLRETFDYTAAEFGVDDPEFEDYTFRSTRNSVALRRNYNLALAYSQKLGFLPKPLNGTSFNVSYNRAYMTARRNGLAPHRISSRLSYAYQKFNGNIGMVWIDDRPDGIVGRYRRELTQFDLSASWTFTPRYRLYVQARNFTGKPDLWMESPAGVKEGRDAAVRIMQEYGSRWVFGLAGRF
jgi:TonB-dependent receptor